MPFKSTKRLKRFCIGAVTVHILATLRKPELLPATLLVFKSIRVGFPSSEIIVQVNPQCDVEGHPGWTIPYSEILISKLVEQELEKSGGPWNRVSHGPTTHHEWLLNLIETEKEPFWICDTDVHFFESMEQFDFNGHPLAGRYVPQFYCDFAGAITRQRIHTFLMRISPSTVKSFVEEYVGQFTDLYCTPRPTLKDLVFPRYTPVRFGCTRKAYFSDTTSLLYQVVGGHSFTDKENEAVGHLGSGTLVDEVSVRYPRGNMMEWHASVLDQPHLLKGQWERDKAFYKSAYSE